jgi:hypothetical protein
VTGENWVMWSFVVCALHQILLGPWNEGGQVARVREVRNTYKILVGKPEGKRPALKPGPRCEDNIKSNGRGMRLEGVDFIHLRASGGLLRIR